MKRFAFFNALLGLGFAAFTGPAIARQPDAPLPEETPAPASAAEQATQDAALVTCFDAFSEAQRLRRDGALLASRAKLHVCAQDPCPQAIAEKCVGWLGELTHEIPGIVVSAKGHDGRDTSAVRVWIDARLVTPALDGRAIEMDPGTHVVRAEHGGRVQELSLVVSVGDKNRKLELSFEERPALPPSPAQPFSDVPRDAQPERGAPLYVSPLVYAGFSVAVTGLVAGAVTGGLALSRASDLQDACPDKVCTSDQRADYDEGVRFAHAATGCLIFGGVGAVVGVVGVVMSGRERTSASAQLVANGQSVMVGVEGHF